MDAALLNVIAGAIRSVSRRTQTMAITADSVLIEGLALDSLDLVGVLMKLEDHFGIEIELDELPNIRTVQELGLHLEQLREGRATAA